MRTAFLLMQILQFHLFTHRGNPITKVEGVNLS